MSISTEEQQLINDTMLEACANNVIYSVRLLINSATNIQECAEESSCCDHYDIFQEIINYDDQNGNILDYNVCSLTATENGCINTLNLIIDKMTNYNECLLLTINKGTILDNRVYLDIGELLLPYSTFDTSILDGLRAKYS